eukprot:940529-Pleurochrysis_carterae.AAC.1
MAAPWPCSALPPSGARPPRGPAEPCPGSAWSGGPCTPPPCGPSQPDRCPRLPDGRPALWPARGGTPFPAAPPPAPAGLGAGLALGAALPGSPPPSVAPPAVPAARLAP